MTDLISIMREHGVSSLKWGDVEIVLGPELTPKPPLFTTTEPVDNSPKPRKIVKPGVRGKDGLTAEEQEEVYLQVIDAVPPEYEE